MNRENSNPRTLSASPVPRRANRLPIVLLTVITGLLLALGVLGWSYLARIDAKYSRVVAEASSSLNELQEVGLHAFTGYGNIIQLRQTRDATARAALRQTVASERAANDRVFAKLERTLTSPELKGCLQDVLAKRRVSRELADAFMAEAENAASTVANPGSSSNLLKSFVAYQQACDQLTDRIESASLQASEEMSREIKRFRFLFLAIGVLPLATALGFVLVSLGLLQVVKIDGEEE